MLQLMIKCGRSVVETLTKLDGHLDRKQIIGLWPDGREWAMSGKCFLIVENSFKSTTACIHTYNQMLSYCDHSCQME